LVVDLRSYLSHRTRLTLERLALSLIAYRLDHGQLPETLGALEPEYIVQVPVDAFSLEAFEYHPRGFELPLMPQEQAFGADSIPAGTPLIWSAGPTFAQLQERWLARVALSDGASEIQWFASEQEARQQHAALNVGDATMEMPPEHVLLLPTMSPQRPYEGAIVIAIPPSADKPSADEEAANNGSDEAERGAGEDSEE
jgi:hypothetical protein